MGCLLNDATATYANSGTCMSATDAVVTISVSHSASTVERSLSANGRARRDWLRACAYSHIARTWRQLMAPPLPEVQPPAEIIDLRRPGPRPRARFEGIGCRNFHKARS